MRRLAEPVVVFRIATEPPVAGPGLWRVLALVPIALAIVPVGGFTGFLARLAVSLAVVAALARLIPARAPRWSEATIRVSRRGLETQGVVVGWDQLGAVRWRADGLGVEHGPFLPFSAMVEGSLDDLRALVGPPPPPSRLEPQPAALGEWSAPRTRTPP